MDQRKSVWLLNSHLWDIVYASQSWLARCPSWSLHENGELVPQPLHRPESMPQVDKVVDLRRKSIMLCKHIHVGMVN